MNLEEAINWYFKGGNKKKEDAKILLKRNTEEARKAMYGGGLGTCTNCGRGIPQLQMNLAGICPACERIADQKEMEARIVVEARSGFRGAAAMRRQVSTDWTTTSVPSISGAFYASNEKYPQIDWGAGSISAQRSDIETEELKAKVKELKEQIEKLQAIDSGESGDNVLITGRKFRKTEEDTAHECSLNRGEEAERTTGRTTGE